MVNGGAFRKLVLDKTADDIYAIVESASRYMTPEEVAELKKRYDEIWKTCFPDEITVEDDNGTAR